MKTRSSVFPGLIMILGLMMILGACTDLSYDPALFSDDEWIAKEGDTYSYVKRSKQFSGDGQSRGLELAFSGFYGKHSVWMIDAATDAALIVEIDIAAGLKGQYKVCLVDPGRQVRILADRPGTLQQEIQLVSGRYYVVLVGMDASGSLAMSLETLVDEDSVVIRAID
ncbi:MAG: hypothetical protein AB7T74_07055 [Clostridia bacterium]